MRVAVFGARGRMGAEVCRAIEQSDHELVAALDQGDDRAPAEAAQVAVDFTTPAAVMDNLLWCVGHGIHTVVGTTGFDEERLNLVRDWLIEAPKVGVLIAANFSIGAIMMMDAARRAAPFFESVEIIELHHPGKVDAPSGTAATTARQVAAARQLAGLGAVPDATEQQIDGARGARVDEIPVHSVRLRGLVAHQEVLFGAQGETLSLRHDSLDRISFMPGVLAAVDAVPDRPGLTLGLEPVLGIE